MNNPRVIVVISRKGKNYMQRLPRAFTYAPLRTEDRTLISATCAACGQSFTGTMLEDEEFMRLLLVHLDTAHPEEFQARAVSP
jgi:hypothetical protein